jgi:hypothetical protein
MARATPSLLSSNFTVYVWPATGLAGDVLVTTIFVLAVDLADAGVLVKPRTTENAQTRLTATQKGRERLCSGRLFMPLRSS